MATVTVRAIPISVTEIGEGRPVLMLHGWPGDHRFMVHHFEPIFDARPVWRRIYPDAGYSLRGRAAHAWVRNPEAKPQG